MLSKLNNIKIKLKYVVGLVVVILGVATTVAVLASIPDSSGVVHVCYKTSNGFLRVMDSATTTCSSGETSLNWNQTGPQGPAGPAGNALAYAHIIRSSSEGPSSIDTDHSQHITSIFSDVPNFDCLQFDSSVTNPHTILVTSGLDGASVGGALSAIDSSLVGSHCTSASADAAV